MKYLKAYKIFESLDKEDTKNVFEPYINWNMIYDLKDLALEYLDRGLTLIVRVRYNDEVYHKEKYTNIIYTICYKHESSASTFSTPSFNIYDLEPIDKSRVLYQISIVDKNSDRMEKETSEVIEILREMYPEIKNNLLSVIKPETLKK
jgi:hypothetical protein